MDSGTPLLRWPGFRKYLYILLTAPFVGLAARKLVANLASTAAYTGVPPVFRLLRAPAQPDPTIANSGTEDIPYPLDALPGGRNIDTPYGNTRAYEWGPVNGRKVLFVHGISTPCIALARMATQLVAGGCRVMLYDIFGRGYSDAPDPTICRQDIRLFAMQILSVLASSPLDWMSGFSLIGYSLGGGIAASFTSYYPNLVRSLVLIAPGGILRPMKVNLSSKVLYSGLLPDWLVNFWVGRKIRAAGIVKPSARASKTLKNTVDIADAAAEELPDGNSAHAQDSLSPLFDDRPMISCATAVAWQLEAHPGFIPSFVSSVRWAPIHDGHERWRLIGERCDAKRQALDPQAESMALKEGRVLLIFGDRDHVIPSDEIAADAIAALGKDNVHIVRLEGGHDLVISNAEKSAQSILQFWAGAT